MENTNKLKGFDAFISYRRGNGFPVAKLIRDQLKLHGVNCYLDLEEDRAGKFNESLLDAIRSAPYFILIETKNVFNRCVNEGDWVRREILAATESGRTVIPIRYPGFVWPKKIAEKLPEKIQMLETQQGVLFSQEYLNATIDKLLSYMTDVSAEDIAPEELPFSTAKFFETCLTQPGVQCVDMAFHAGAE